MSAPHTPGPWHTRPNDPWAVYADAEATMTICDIRHRGSHISEANARLIAAAPDLLEPAQDLVHGHEQVPSVPVSDTDRTCVCIYCVKFKRAIAKALQQPDPYPSFPPIVTRAWLHDWHTMERRRQAEANARVTAGGPDLLTTAKDWLRYERDADWREQKEQEAERATAGNVSFGEALLDQLERAIAKAEGRGS